MYVMHTMSRMRMASDFYPSLNVKKLFKLVTMKNFGVEMLNPQLLTLTGGEVSADSEVDGWEGVWGDQILSFQTTDKKAQEKKKFYHYSHKDEISSSHKGN